MTFAGAERYLFDIIKEVGALPSGLAWFFPTGRMSASKTSKSTVNLLIRLLKQNR
jgi:hypothetical protein